MWLHPVSVKKNVQKYILPKLCLTPEIKSKYFRTGECVGIGQTTVPFLEIKTKHFNSIIKKSTANMNVFSSKHGVMEQTKYMYNKMLMISTPHTSIREKNASTCTS